MVASIVHYITYSFKKFCHTVRLICLDYNSAFGSHSGKGENPGLAYIEAVS